MAEKYTAAQIIAAIKASKGMVFVTARKLGCSSQTIYNYVKRYPSIQDAIREERGVLLDEAESALAKAIRLGEGWAVCFTLKTIGRERGYVERQEFSGPGGGPIEVDIAQLTDEERIARIVALFDRARERRDRQAVTTVSPVGALTGATDAGVPE